MERLDVGSISHGTMRSQDLIPCFLSELALRDQERYEQIEKEFSITIMNEDWETETGAYLLEDLFDALDSAAPDGYYFGASEGDGCDYGFWSYEDDDCE